MADGSNNITNLSIEITANADRAARTFDRLASSAERMGGSARNAAGGMRVLNDNMRQARGDAESTRASLGDFMSRIGNLSASVGKFGSGIKTAFKGIASAVKLASKPVSIFGKQLGTELGGGLKMITGPLTGFLSSLLRIAKIRILRSIIKDIGQSFKDLYGWSKAFGTEFSKSMNTINTATTYLRNSLAAMVAPLADALAPVIDTIVDKIVEAINWVNQLFAALTGASTYTVAKKVAIEWGDTFTNSSNKAKKSVDKFKQSLMSFDEINSLKAPKDDSSSGNTGSSPYSDQYKLMFEQKKLPNSFGDIKNFAEQLKAAVKASDWKGVGTLIGNKVNELISKIDFAGAGAKVGKGINAWFSTKYWTLDAINFTNIGASIADFLNNAILEIDFSTVGASISQKVGIIGDTIIGFFTTFDWGTAAGAISDFIIGMYNELTKWFKSIVWVDIGSALYDNLKKVLTTVNFAGIARAILTFLGTALKALIDLGYGFISSFWDDVAAWWKDNIDTDDTNFISVAGAVLKAIAKGFLNIGVWVFNNIIDPFMTALLGEKWDKLKDAGKTAIGKVKEGWDTLSNFTVTATIWLVKKVSKLAVDAWNFINNKVSPVVSVGISLFKKGWNTLAKFIGTAVSVGISLFKEGWTTIKDFIGTIVSVAISLKKFQWTTISKFVGTAVSVFISLIRSGWKTITKFVGDSVNVGISLFKENFTSLASFLGLGKNNSLKINVNGGNVTYRKRGGVFSGGIWSSIPQYAGGTTDAHGSLFLAGEAGPEIVGHVGNRTEILNRSQLASTMYQSVTAAMATAAGMYRDDSSSVDYAQLADAIAVAVAGELKRAGVGATYLDGRMLAQSINRESRRLGTPAVTF